MSRNQRRRSSAKSVPSDTSSKAPGSQAEVAVRSPSQGSGQYSQDYPSQTVVMPKGVRVSSQQSGNRARSASLIPQSAARRDSRTPSQSAARRDSRTPSQSPVRRDSRTPSQSAARKSSGTPSQGAVPKSSQSKGSSGYEASKVSSAPVFERSSSTSSAQNTYVFTLGELKTVQKPIKNYVYFAKLYFLCFQSFNLVYLSTAFYIIFDALENHDLKMLLMHEFGLSLITVIFTIRMIKSCYGIYAVLFARSRRPLYLYLLFNYFVSVLYILVGLVLIFTPYMGWRFGTLLEEHTENLESHKEHEKPTWYLIENVQYYGRCCGYHSVLDYLNYYARKQNTRDLFRTDFHLPTTCCKNAIRGDLCTVHKEDVIVRGCAEFVQDEAMNNIGLSILMLLFTDVMSLVFIVYLMRRFKDNLVRIEIKEDTEAFVDREEGRLIRELLAAGFIQNADKEKIKTKYKSTIKVEQAFGLRPTLEGLTLVIRKDLQNGELHFEVRTLNPGMLRAETNNNYKYLESQFKTGFKDLFKKQADEEKNMVENIMLPSKIKERNTLLMAGGEPLSSRDAEKNLAQFGLEKKIHPWQAVRTRNAVVAINRKQDKSKSLRKHGLGPQRIRFNSAETRLDKTTIERDLRELKALGEGAIAPTLKSRIATSRVSGADEEKMNIKILRKDSRKPSNLRRSRMARAKTTSDIIEDKEEGGDEWDDIKRKDH